MARFPWSSVSGMLLAACVLADLLVLHGPVYRRVMLSPSAIHHSPSINAALVGEATITRNELEEAMRDYLWRRGEEWSGLSEDEERATRRAVVGKLVDDRLVRAARVKEGFDLQGTSVADELAMFARQFEREGDYERRLGLRQMTETELINGIQAATADQAWIESKIAARMQPVAQQDVNDWLANNRSLVALPARYGVAHIYLTTHDAKKVDREVEIREIHRKLTSGEATFEALAAQFSDDERSKKTGGQLGWCARGRMPDDFMNAVEKLEEGETSEPVETKLGWHVIRLIDKQAARMSAVDEIKNEVVATLQNERRADAVKSLMAGLRAEASVAITLNEELIESAEPSR